MRTETLSPSRYVDAVVLPEGGIVIDWHDDPQDGTQTQEIPAVAADTPAPSLRPAAPDVAPVAAPNTTPVPHDTTDYRGRVWKARDWVSPSRIALKAWATWKSAQTDNKPVSTWEAYNKLPQWAQKSADFADNLIHSSYLLTAGVLAMRAVSAYNGMKFGGPTIHVDGMPQLEFASHSTTIPDMSDHYQAPSHHLSIELKVPDHEPVTKVATGHNPLTGRADSVTDWAKADIRQACEQAGIPDDQIKLLLKDDIQVQKVMGGYYAGNADLAADPQHYLEAGHTYSADQALQNAHGIADKLAADLGIAPAVEYGDTVPGPNPDGGAAWPEQTVPPAADAAPVQPGPSVNPTVPQPSASGSSPAQQFPPPFGQYSVAPPETANPSASPSVTPEAPAASAEIPSPAPSAEATTEPPVVGLPEPIPTDSPEAFMPDDGKLESGLEKPQTTTYSSPLPPQPTHVQVYVPRETQVTHDLASSLALYAFGKAMLVGANTVAVLAATDRLRDREMRSYLARRDEAQGRDRSEDSED